MTLLKDLARFTGMPEETNPYKDYHLLRNPFPEYGDKVIEVCTDQDLIKDKFIYVLENFFSEAKRLRINGKHGAGKTNILRYFGRLTDEARLSKSIKNVYPIYINTPDESYFDIHGQIIDKLSELFLDDLLKTLQSDRQQIDALAKEIKPASELLMAIKTLVEDNNTLFPIYSERHEDIFIRWLKGRKLVATDRKLLTYDGTPPTDITSPSLAIRFLHGLLEVLKELRLCDGIVLLFDEFEEIFTSLARSRQSRYAQDLRHLFDTLTESVFFVIATLPEPRDLSQYPAIERRLGEPLELQPIDSLELAVEYVEDYLNRGREKYEASRNTHQKQVELDRTDELRPLTEDDVKHEYCLLKQQAEKAEFDVLPGYFLPKMRERIKQIVENNR